MKILTVFFYARIVVGQIYHDPSRLQIQVPSSLFKAGGYDHRGALFGTPPYGATIMQPLYYADSDLCDATVDKRKGYPTRPNDDSGQMAPWKPPFILMMDRGGCSFVQKVRNAQHAGAAGVIIADNVCVCGNAECMNATAADGEKCEQFEPTMSDDGSGGDIAIPAFLMFKHDADLIKKEAVDKNQHIQVEMGWTMPRAPDRVKYDIWSSPGDKIGDEFLRNWGPIATKLADHTEFTPHQYIFSGVEMCVDEQGTNMCVDMCTNNGRYCANVVAGRGITGAKVVSESLRRICVWQNFGASGSYWDYIKYFSDLCTTGELFSSAACLDDVFKRAGIDKGIINNCMSDSGGTSPGVKGGNTNSLLDKQIDSQEENGIIIVPTILVNTMHFSGGLTVPNVFHVICAGFLDENAPELCKVCDKCSEKLACVEEGFCASQNTTDSGSISKRSFGLTLLCLCSIFGVAAYIHWKRTREEMRDRVRDILAEYMPLQGGEDEEGSYPMDFARKGTAASLIE